MRKASLAPLRSLASLVSLASLTSLPALLAGCGGEEPSGSTTSGTTTTTTTTTTSSGPGGSGGEAGAGGMGQGGAGGNGTGGAGGNGTGTGGAGGTGGGPSFTCGNDLIEPGETCDDANTTAGDGCSDACQLEAGTICGSAVDLNDPMVVSVSGAVTTYDGTTAGSALMSFGDPSCSTGGMGVPTVIHRYIPAADALLSVELVDLPGLTDVADTVAWSYLDCLDTSAELACDDDGGADLLSSMPAGPVPQGVPVFLVVSGYGATDVGPYRLRITESPATMVGASGTCVAPVGAGAGSYIGATLASDPSALSGSCTGAMAPEAVYALTLAAGADIRVTASASLWDLGVYLTFAPCGAGVELACADVGTAGDAETIAVRDLAAGTYYLVVDGYTAMDHGDYTLSVDARTIVPPGGACDPANPAERCATGTACVGPSGARMCTNTTTLVAADFGMALAPLLIEDAGMDGQGWIWCDGGVACGYSSTIWSATGGAFALVRDAGGVTLDGEGLATPPLDATATTYVVLEFDHEFDHAAGANDLGVVEVKVGAAGAWTPVASFQTDTQGRAWVDLSGMVAGQSFQVRFRYDDDTTNMGGLAGGWGVDDVRISGL